MTRAAPGPARPTGTHRASGAGQLLPRPSGLVHRARAGRGRTGASPRSPGGRPTSPTPLTAQDGPLHADHPGRRRRHGRDRPGHQPRVTRDPTLARLVGYLADPAVGVVTLTVTEAGICADRTASRTCEPPDVPRRHRTPRRPADRTGIANVPARLAAGLLARRAAGGGPLAVVPCDNLPDNGRGRPRLSSPTSRDWSTRAWAPGSATNVAFVTTMVDRITPATTDGDSRPPADLDRFADAAPVVTEPFTEWVLAGDFPAGRPGLGGRRGQIRRRRHPVRGAKTVAAQRRSQPARLRGRALAATPPSPRRSPIRTAGSGSSSGGTRPAPHLTLPAAGRRRLPPSPARTLRQPADPAPAGPDRRRRLAEAPDPDPARPPPRTGRGPDAGRRPCASSPPGSTTCAAPAPRSRTRTVELLAALAAGDRSTAVPRCWAPWTRRLTDDPAPRRRGGRRSPQNWPPR